MFCRGLALCKYSKLKQHARTSNRQYVTWQKHNTHISDITSEKYYFDIFSPHNRNRAVFVPGAIAIVAFFVAVGKSTSTCGCGFAVVSFHAFVTQLRLFDPSLM